MCVFFFLSVSLLSLQALSDSREKGGAPMVVGKGGSGNRARDHPSSNRSRWELVRWICEFSGIGANKARRSHFTLVSLFPTSSLVAVASGICHCSQGVYTHDRVSLFGHLSLLQLFSSPSPTSSHGSGLLPPLPSYKAVPGSQARSGGPGLD